MWENVRGVLDDSSLEMALLSQAMTPFHMGKGISAEQAVAFFESAEPDYGRRAMKKAPGIMRPGTQTVPLKELLKQVGRLI